MLSKGKKKLFKCPTCYSPNILKPNNYYVTLVNSEDKEVRYLSAYRVGFCKRCWDFFQWKRRVNIKMTHNAVHHVRDLEESILLAHGKEFLEAYKSEGLKLGTVYEAN